MAVQLDARRPGAPGPAAERLKGLDGAPTDEALLTALGVADTLENRARARREWIKLTVAEALRADFMLDAAGIADRTGIPQRDIERTIATAKRTAAAGWVEQVLSTRPDATLADVRAAAFGDPTPRNDADDEDLRHAFRAHRGLNELAAHVTGATELRHARLFRAPTAVPLLSPVGAGALDLAAVDFMADDDGIVRRVPPLVRYGDGVIMHMGVAAAAHILNLNLADAAMPDDRTLRIPGRGGEHVAVPLDGDGNMLIPWTQTATGWRIGRDFPHISAGALVAIADAREAVADNERRLLYAWADVVAAVKAPMSVTNPETGESQTQYGDAAYRAMVRELMEVRAARAKEQAGAPAEALAGRADELEAQIAAEQNHASSALAYFAAQIDALSADDIAGDESIRATVERVRRGQAARQTVDRLVAANARIEAEIESGMARLREVLGGKYVFVGFAATAQGDIVSTAIDSRTNGVMCHANVLNAFLQNRFITVAPPLAQWPLCLLGGALVGWWTAVRSPRFALTATLLLVVGVAGVNLLVLFQQLDTWYVLTHFIVTVGACWAAVTLFRQLTAERDKRLFRAQLSQYTSPAIASRIAESPEAIEAFKKVQTRDVTCYFSDLAGFTSISEREDAELVQHVLNTYLERMCAAIWARRGLINKFMGDGIMAFFNPSVDPLDDHARIACEAALDTLDALDALKRDMADDVAGHVFEQLNMRVGLASGSVKNGDMGSELKADYTVIGDVVNLAARLEPANKVFGTRILISSALRERVREFYDVRYLAELQVKGKRQTVPVYELIGRRGTLSAEAKSYVERFEQGVALYRAREWDACIVHFTRLLARRPDDLGAGRYIDACQEMKAFPPDEDWAGALELKEK